VENGRAYPRIGTLLSNMTLQMELITGMELNTGLRLMELDGCVQIWGGQQMIGEMVPYLHDDIQYKDKVELIGDGVFKWNREFIGPNNRSVHCRLTMDFEVAYRPEYYMIPAVSYNGNPWGKGSEPRGLFENGTPWSFAWHRTAVAGATYTEGGEWSVALFGSRDELQRGFSCSLAKEGERTVHRLIWPEEEMPRVYNDRDRYGEGLQEEWILQPGECVRLTATMVIAPVERPKTAWHKLLDTAWTMNRKQPMPWYGPERVWELGISYAKHSLWVQDGSFQGFSIGLMHDGEKWVPHRHYEIGWCGQNASLANSFLFDYIRSGREESLAMGLAVLDAWSNTGRMNNGLIHCHYDYLLFKRQENEVQDACNLGTAALNMMEAAQLAQACGAERPHYLETAIGICDFAVRAQSDSGRIGKSWSNDGMPVDPNGTVGCFLIPPLVMAYQITRDHKYLDAAERGYRYYISELLEEGYTTAGALDTYCIDKESAIPLLKAGLSLYDATGNRRYLEWAELAAWYLASWQWHHTVRYPEDSALAMLNYDTFGGTAVSTQHHHIDPYALAFVEDWLQLAERTGNAVWRERAVAAWTNATIGLSDGTLTVMGKRRPVGSQDEGFYHTRWKNTFQVSEWLVAWPTAFRLEVLRRTKDWSLFKSG
jgi:hypothetical protein